MTEVTFGHQILDEVLDGERRRNLRLTMPTAPRFWQEMKAHHWLRAL